MNVIIIGCGKFGSCLSRQLSDEGYNLAIVDRSEQKLNQLGTGFNGSRIRGVEFDKDVLEEAGIETTDILIACSSDDNINITTCLIAERIYHVKNIIARINDPEKIFLYDKLGIQTINPVQYEIDMIRAIL